MAFHRDIHEAKPEPLSWQALRELRRLWFRPAEVAMKNHRNFRRAIGKTVLNAYYIDTFASPTPILPRSEPASASASALEGRCDSRTL